MNKTKLGIGHLAAVVLATMLAACATPNVSNGSGAQVVPVEAHSHDIHFY